MTNACQFSHNTEKYIQKYQSILKDMTFQMSSATMTDSISGSFIVQMIPHHRAAIEMSENLLTYTTNVPLQMIAENIISTQKKSISDMMSVYQKCQRFCNPRQVLSCYHNRNRAILNTMFQKMNSACTDNNIDATFIRQMIPHHQGAVSMSELALCNQLCPELIPLLNAIISSQKEGICQMQRLLSRITC